MYHDPSMALMLLSTTENAVVKICGEFYSQCFFQYESTNNSNFLNPLVSIWLEAA